MPKKKIGRWSKEEVATLKKMYKNTSTQEVADALNRKYESVQNKAFYLGLKKTRTYLRSVGLAI